MDDALQALIRDKRVTCLFQPIVDSRARAVLGYEALARGPSDSPLHAPSVLFEAATRAGCLPVLDALCFERAAENKRALDLPGRLFVNVTAQGLRHFGQQPQIVAATLERTGLNARDLVFELTEQAIVDDYQVIRGAMRAIQNLGAAFAIDDLGTGYSGLRAWSELHPEFVKIDRYFVNGVDTDSRKMEFVHAIIDLARATRSTVIAEGVETAAEARELVDAGVSLLQGFYVARPHQDPPTQLSDTMIQRCPVAELDNPIRTARELTFESPTIAPDMPVSKVAEFMHAHVDVNAVAVVNGERPVGIVRRLELLNLLSIPLRLELYQRKPISTLMDSKPLLIESDLRLEQVSRLVTRGYREAIQEQFIVTDHGKYVGLARMVDLLRTITLEQLQVARHANPLTLLPGSVPIFSCMNRLVRRGKRFVLCQLDIDNFKPFNDFYGYGKGDEALLLLARLLGRHTSPRIDFLGHVGGDDFVVVFRSADWKDRLERVLADFARALDSLYDAKHLAERGILATDRYGTQRMFPLLTVSVAALICDAPAGVNAEEFANHLAPLKARAKAHSGSNIQAANYRDMIEPRVQSSDARGERARA